VGEIFTKYAGAASEVGSLEPYLVGSWQIRNFQDWLDALVTLTHIRAVRLTTHVRSQFAQAELEEVLMRYGRLGLHVTIAYQADLHLREVAFSNGVVVVSDRGFDIFKAASAQGVRACRDTSILYYECSVHEVVRESNVASRVALEAKSELIDSVSQDILAIHAAVAQGGAALVPAAAVRTVKDQLADKLVSDWLRELGFVFSEGFSVSDVVSDARACHKDPLTNEGFKDEVRSLLSIGVLQSRRDFTSDEFELFPVGRSGLLRRPLASTLAAAFVAPDAAPSDSAVTLAVPLEIQHAVLAALEDADPDRDTLQQLLRRVEDQLGRPIPASELQTTREELRRLVLSRLPTASAVTPWFPVTISTMY
jgi:hypothetical protein